MIEQMQVKPMWTELQAQLSGAVIPAGDPRYDEARLAWNRKITHAPAAIIVAQSAEDVAAAVTFAQHHDLGVAVQATGHGVVRPADDACLLILTRALNTIAIDPVAQTATVGAGVQWGPVLAAAQEHGLAPLLGSSPTVGAVGYTLGGGLGWLGRKYGLAADHVLEFQIVTPDGQLRTVSAQENSDLYWGLRGGGGSLGVVTAMTIRLFPVSTVYAGNLYYPGHMAQEVFRRYRDWVANAPDELTTSVLVMNYPPLPQLPEFLRGQTFVQVRGCYCGSVEEGEAQLRFWREWQAPLIDDFRAIPFSQAATISNDPIDPMPAFNSGAWLRTLSDAAIDTIVDHAMPQGGPPPLIFAEVRHAGGAIHREVGGKAVIGNREAEFVLSLVAVTPTPDAQAHVAAHTEHLMAALQPALTGGVYMNFLEGEESRQRIRDGLGHDNYARLAQIKAQVDPANRLRYGFNVTPAS